MIILGVDPGIADTGWGLIEKDSKGHVFHIAHGSIKTPKTDSLSDRLISLYSQLNAIIDKYQPGVAAIEELFFSKNVKTALTVGQARGVILLSLKMKDISVFEFKPSQVKQAVAAYGQAGKLQVQKMVKLLLNLKDIPRPDDAADALALAICLSAIKNYG
ncbi:MAG: crossover junction endodeoxyribonuclease RuvC [Patescibacteria group bacterium]